MHDQPNRRFEIQVDGKTAYIRYHIHNGAMNFLTTQVPGALEGQGIASALTQEALEYARQERLKVIPSCSFTAAYIRRHPEYADLLL